MPYALGHAANNTKEKASEKMKFGGNKNIIFAETYVLIYEKYVTFFKCMILMKLSVRNLAIFQITIEKS